MKFDDLGAHDYKNDEYYTPEVALECLLDYVPKSSVVWDCTDTSGNITGFFGRNGYGVVSTKDDFFTHSEGLGDILITNPPYSKKTDFLKHAYELGKPFAMLLPLTALEGVNRQKLYREYGLQLILFNRRINFIKGKSGVWFATGWFTYNMNLPRDMNFIEVE